MSTKQLARLVGESEKTVKRLIAELEAAAVFSRTEAGVIYSRRMVKDERLREVRVQAGKLGGNPILLNHQVNLDPTLTPPPSSSSSSSSSSSENIYPNSRGEKNGKCKSPDIPVANENPDLDQLAESIVEHYLAVVQTPHFSAKAIAVVRDLLDQGISAEELLRAADGQAEDYDRLEIERRSKWRVGALKFFGDGAWKAFSKVPETPAEREKHRQEELRKEEIARQKQSEKTQKWAEEKRAEAAKLAEENEKEAAAKQAREEAMIAKYGPDRSTWPTIAGAYNAMRKRDTAKEAVVYYDAKAGSSHGGNDEAQTHVIAIIDAHGYSLERLKEIVDAYVADKAANKLLPFGAARFWREEWKRYLQKPMTAQEKREAEGKAAHARSQAHIAWLKAPVETRGLEPPHD